MTTDNYKHFFGARLARENNVVNTCAFRMPNFEKPIDNVPAKCYNISQNEVLQPAFLTYNYENIVPKDKIYTNSGDRYKWGLVSFMGSEILAANGKFVFNTPIARHKQISSDGQSCGSGAFCWRNERMSGSIASYDGSNYQIGKHT